MTDPVLLGVDWGSSRLRGYAVAADGGILETAHSDAGILLADRADLAGALAALLGDWSTRWPHAPIVASGMVGSRNGLKEVAYVGTPARAEDVRNGMEVVDVGGVPVAIVPGLVHRGESGVDVMRGEETILFGCAAGTGTVVLPGTHSKWARVDGGRVTEFCTFATGELFDSLLHSGSLRELLPAEAGHDAKAFRDGVHRGLESSGILHDYFAVRAEVVSGGASAAGIPSRLSGLLIGHEIAEALGRSLLAPGEPITIVGDGALVESYGDAVGIAGLTASVLPAVPCLARGWLLLANDLPRGVS